jgi:hypothetical protein
MVDFIKLAHPPAQGEWAIDLCVSLPAAKACGGYGRVSGGCSLGPLCVAA